PRTLRFQNSAQRRFRLPFKRLRDLHGRLTRVWGVIRRRRRYVPLNKDKKPGWEIAMKRLLVLALLALPLPAFGQANAQLVDQGRALFNDPKLSGSGQLSCATCHPMNGHTDNKTYVVAEVVADGDPKGRSTPTLWGAGIRQAEWSWAGNIP